MAQSGFYVPCESFTYNPYKYIFTRIIGNDNIFKGLSTFAVEMYELKSILENSDNKSLILGDELCSGTEIESASVFLLQVCNFYTEKIVLLFLQHIYMKLPNILK